MKLSELPWMDRIAIRNTFVNMREEDIDVVHVAPRTTTVYVPMTPLYSMDGREAERRAMQMMKQEVPLWAIAGSDIIGGWDGSHTFFMWPRPV